MLILRNYSIQVPLPRTQSQIRTGLARSSPAIDALRWHDCLLWQPVATSVGVSSPRGTTSMVRPAAEIAVVFPIESPLNPGVA